MKTSETDSRSAPSVHLFLTNNCMLLDFQSVDSESLRSEDCRVHSSNYVFEQTFNTVMERSVKHDV